MNITTNVSTQPKACSRCLDIGIPGNNIQSGELYYIFSDGEQDHNCCLDCFRRLQEELAQD